LAAARLVVPAPAVSNSGPACTDGDGWVRLAELERPLWIGYQQWIFGGICA
jgi:hypothetical protein